MPIPLWHRDWARPRRAFSIWMAGAGVKPGLTYGRPMIRLRRHGKSNECRRLARYGVAPVGLTISGYEEDGLKENDFAV
jgi:hypothetical protein